MFNEKQKQILDTAEKLFAIHGFDGTSIREIAASAHVNVAMINYYFGSKEKLMKALFQNRTETSRMRRETLLHDNTLDPFKKLEIVVDEYVDKVWEKQRFFKVMVHEQILEKGSIVTKWLKDVKKQNLEFIEKLVKEGQKKKLFKKNVDTVMLVTTMTGTALQSFLNKDVYKQFHHSGEIDSATFDRQLREKTKIHIRSLFKAILNYEA